MTRDHLSTGIDSLDRRLEGGLRPGSIVTLTAPPASQSGPLFRALMRERPTLYVTTFRTADAVRDELSYLTRPTEAVDVEHVGIKKPIKGVYSTLQELEGQRNVIVDTMNPMESERRERYVDFLNGLKQYLLESDSLALLHCTKSDPTPSLRDVTLTISDVVWDLEVVVKNDTVENQLTVPKFRAREVVDDVIKLDLGLEATVDTSRGL